MPHRSSSSPDEQLPQNVHVPADVVVAACESLIEHLLKATRGEDVQVEHPVWCGCPPVTSPYTDRLISQSAKRRPLIIHA